MYCNICKKSISQGFVDRCDDPILTYKRSGNEVFDSGSYYCADCYEGLPRERVELGNVFMGDRDSLSYKNNRDNWLHTRNTKKEKQGFYKRR